MPGHLSKEERALLEVLAHDPGSNDARTQLAELWERAGEPERAALLMGRQVEPQALRRIIERYGRQGFVVDPAGWMGGFERDAWAFAAGSFLDVEATFRLSPRCYRLLELRVSGVYSGQRLTAGGSTDRICVRPIDPARVGRVEVLARAFQHHGVPPLLDRVVILNDQRPAVVDSLGLAYPWAGRDLQEACLRESGPLPLSEAIEITLELCAIIAAAHAQGLRHSAISPQHVLLDHSHPRGRRVSLVGWGHAHGPLLPTLEVTPRDPLEPEDLTVRDALRYCAPEQIRGEATMASDLWGIAAVTCALVFGRHVWHDLDEPLDIAEAIVRHGLRTSDMFPPRVRRVLEMAFRPRSERPLVAEWAEVLRDAAFDERLDVH